MPVSKKQIEKLLHEIAPLEYAYGWDNSGFNIDINEEITGIYVCLDVLERDVEEAKEKGCNLIVCHHPLLFKPVKKIGISDHIGKIICLLIKNGISLYACHTPMDNVKGGINTYIGEKLGLHNTEMLDDIITEKYCKIVTTVPFDYESTVKQAAFLKGAGKLGDYSKCSYSNDGMGQFEPDENAEPFIGEKNALEYVEEKRVEFLCREKDSYSVVNAIKDAHPYEEPAIDVYSLEYPNKAAAGAGIIGDLEEECSVYCLADKLKKIFDIDVLRIGGSTDKTVKKAAFCSGAAGDFISAAERKGADVYITGEVKQNQYVEAQNITVIEAGHYDTEKCFVQIMAGSLQKGINRLKYKLNVVEAEEKLRTFINY